MLDHLQSTFQRDGYVVIENFFTPAEMTAAQHELDAHFQIATQLRHAANFKAAQTEVISWNPVAEGVKAFVDLFESDTLAKATRSVLGGDFVANGSLVMCSPPHSIGQAWHQDCPNDNPAHFNLNRLVYTHDIGDNGGEVVVVPGSHRMAEIPPGEPHGDMAGQVTLSPKAGTLVFLHGFTYHRVTPVKQRRRISCNFRVVPAGSPADITRIGVYRNMKYDFVTGQPIAR